MTSKEKALIYHQRLFLQFIYAGLGSDFGIQLGIQVVNRISAPTIVKCRKPGAPRKKFIISQFVDNARWEQVFYA